MPCRTIELSGESRESLAWDSIYKQIKSEEEADRIYESLLTDEFINQYGEDWTLTGVEPTVIDGGIQAIDGTKINFQTTNKPSLSALDRKMLDFIEQNGISTSWVKSIKDKFGDSANAVINFTDLTLQLKEGALKEDTLTEEAMHVYVELLEQNEFGVFASMMSNIESYPEYQEVMESYGEAYEGDIIPIKKEAIAKLLTKKVQNQTKDIKAGVWWNKIKQLIQRLFNNISSEQFQDIFDIKAKEFYSNPKIQYYKLNPSRSKFYQLENHNWTSVKSKLVDVTSMLGKALKRDADGQLRDYYTFKGNEVKNRVTEIIKRKSKHSYTFTEEEQKVNDKKAEYGTLGHAAINNIISRILEKKSSNEVKTEKLKDIDSKVYQDLENYVTNLLNLPEFEGAEVFTEQMVYDENRDLAGTLDLVVLDKKGVAHIFDFKFITDKGYISASKRREWNSQIEQYKGILKSYGVSKFGYQRMIPFFVEYSDKGVPLSTKIGTETFKYAVPAKEERTGDTNIDSLIEKLYRDYETLSKNNRIEYSSKQDRLAIISKTIEDLKVKKDLEQFKSYIENEIDRFSAKLDGEVTEDDISEVFYFSNYYSDIDTKLRLPELNATSEKAKQLNSKFYFKFQDWAKSQDLNKEVFKPISGFSYNFTSLGSVNNPVFKYLNNIVQEANNKIESDTNRVYNRLKELKIKSFDPILEKTKDGNYTGSFISQYKKEFYDKVRTEGLAWKKKNIKIRDVVKVEGIEMSAKDHFLKELKLKEERLKALTPNEREIEIERFRNYNDFFHDKYKDKAIKNYKGVNKYIKPSDNWYTDEYTNIKDNSESALSQAYDLFQELLEEAKLYNSSETKINTKTIPSIDKSLISKILNNGFSFSRLKDYVIDSLSVKEYENSSGDRKLHVKFLEDLRAEKSLELNEVFTLFAESVYRVKYMSEIESKVHLASTILKEGNYIKLSNTGKPILKDGEVQKTRDPQDSTVKTFNKFVDAYVYDIKNTHDVNIAGVSGNKLLNQALGYNALLKIGGNLISAAGNLVGGKANAYIEARSGRFFSVKDLASSEVAFTSRDPKAMAAIEYFDVFTDNTIYNKAKDLRLSTLDKKFNTDFIMFAQGATERAVQYPVLFAYLKGMTVDENGKVRRKVEGEKSIYESMEIVNGEIKMPENLKEEAYNRIRLAVKELNSRLTGAKNDRGKMLYAQDTHWRALAQFKSWMFPMAKERFGGFDYNDNLGLYEEGRATSIFKAVFNKRYGLQSTGALIKGLLTFNARAVTIGAKKALIERYEDVLRLNPDINPNEFTLEQYEALFEQNIRSLILELYVITGALGVVLGYSNFGDDEEKSKRGVTKVLDRFYDELAYFYSIGSYMDLGGVSLPLMSTLEDVTGFISNDILGNAWTISQGEEVNIDKFNKDASKIFLPMKYWSRYTEYSGLINEITE